MDVDWMQVAEIMKRLAVATVCGACIGYERDVHGRAAGLRTHMLVAAGAALFTVISMLCAGCPLEVDSLRQLNGDVCRIAAQIVSGIGFMGAGTIVKTGFTVRGLTTAACLWFAAALGMACGIDQCMIALIAAAMATVMVFIGKRLEHRLHRVFPFQLIVETEDDEAVEAVRRYILANSIYRITTLNLAVATSPRHVRANFYIDTDCRNEQQSSCIELTNYISKKIPGVVSVTYKSEG